MIPLYPWEPERYIQVLNPMACEVTDPISLIDRWIDTQGNKSETYGQEIATLIKATRR